MCRKLTDMSSRMTKIHLYLERILIFHGRFIKNIYLEFAFFSILLRMISIYLGNFWNYSIFLTHNLDPANATHISRKSYDVASYSGTAYTCQQFYKRPPISKYPVNFLYHLINDRFPFVGK